MQNVHCEDEFEKKSSLTFTGCGSTAYVSNCDANLRK